METGATPSKQALRAALKARLKRPVTEADAAALRRRLEAFLAAGAYGTLVAFVPMADEPDIRPVMAAALAAGKALFLPRYDGGSRLYELVRVANLEADLERGHYGIDEPRANLPAAESLPSATLWLIPALAFDPRRGTRLGRGGGFYDRLLTRYPDGFRLGIAWDFQIRHDLPAEAHDRPVDAILTDAALYRPGFKIGQTHERMDGFPDMPV